MNQSTNQSTNQSLTNFRKVAEFHETFEHPINVAFDSDIFINNKKLVKLRIELIDEECREFREAMRDKDIVETVDALCDILYVVNGAGLAFGIDLDLMMKEVLANQPIDPHRFLVDDYPDTPNTFFENGYYVNACRRMMEFSLKNFHHAMESQEETRISYSLCHLIITCDAIGRLIDVNLGEAFDRVHQNNMTKACQSEDEAIATVLARRAEGHDPDYKLASNKRYWIVFNRKTGKILKSVNYTPVDLTYILKN